MARIRPVTRLRAGNSSVSGSVYAEHTGSGLLVPASSTLAGTGNVSSQDPDPPEGALFHDDFSSGNLNHEENGISWGGSRNVDIVPDAGNPSGFSMRLRYNEVPGVRSWAEQRFDLGGEYTEIWLRYKIVIPSNFWLVPDGSADNNKWFRLWGYDEEWVEVGFSIRPDTPEGEAELISELSNDTHPAGRYGTPIISNFITEEDYGEEMDIVIHVKTDTSGIPDLIPEGSGGNGILRLWKNGQLLVDLTEIVNTPTGSGAVNAFTDGYLMGAPNANYGHPDLTTHDFLIREVTFADSDIWGVSE